MPLPFWIVVCVFALSMALLLVGAWKVCTHAIGRTSRIHPNPHSGPSPQDNDWAADHRGEDWTQKAADGLTLRAYSFPSSCDSHHWAILVHGYRDHALSAFPWAEEFHRRGYHVLAVDCRAHGRSEGGVIGMGWTDRRDLIGWMDLILRQDPEARIILYGVSMGAATVMMAAGEPDFPDAVVCGVADCGFTSVRDIYLYRARHKLRMLAVPLLYLTDWICRLRFQLHFSDASSVRQLERSRCPMLFIHGEEDRYVPFYMVRILFDAAAGPKQLYTVPGARHAASAETDPAYWTQVFTFIQCYLPERTRSQ